MTVVQIYLAHVLKLFFLWFVEWKFIYCVRFLFIGPKIIIEQEHSVDQLLLKNISVKVRENVRTVAILVVNARQCHLAAV